MAVWRLRHPTVLAAVLALAVTSAATAALPAEHAAPAPAARTAATAAASGRYELVSTVDPTRPMPWPACRPIEYRVDPTDMPAGMVSTVQHAMGIVARQTGVRFRSAGRTAHTFDSTTHAGTPTVYFAFTGRARASGQTFGGADGEVGVGGPAASWYRTGGRTVEGMTYGRVLLSSRFRAPRTGGGVSWQTLILHEVGLALDLAHRGGPATIMHPSLSAATPARFTPAEVRALRRVLQTSGCDDAAWSRL